MIHVWRLFIRSVCLMFARKVVIKLIRSASYKDYNKILLPCYDREEMNNLILLHELECMYDNWKL